MMNILPCGFTILDNQVAGHSFQEGKQTIGILKQSDGKILKPATKESEITFYESLQCTKDPILLDLRNLVPLYYGSCQLKINDNYVKFMILENLTVDMKEPSVIDIKIGKQTWDLNATLEKIEGEKKKYTQTKLDLGLSLPGFVVYDLYSSIVLQFGKDHGKNLNKNTFIDSIKLFFNAQRSFNQHLLVQILGQLWRILFWWQKQTKLLIFSSSILIAYDTTKLRKCHKIVEKRKSILPQTTKSIRKHRMLNFLDQNPRKTVMEHDKQWHINFENQFDLKNFIAKDLQVLKDEYFEYLGKSGFENIDITHQWVKIKMIDFAHVFPTGNDQQCDENYLEGFCNLVKIVENLFIESVMLNSC